MFISVSLFSCTKDDPIPTPKPPVVLDRCKGIILGEFDGCGTEFKDEYGNTISVETMLHKIFAPYNIPVLCGFPAGHGDVNLPLVMGAPVTIDVRSMGSTISFGIEGQQKEYQVSPDLKSTKSSLDIRMMLAGKKTFGYEKD